MADNGGSQAPVLADDGERFLPEAMSGDIELEHMHRYALARELAHGKRVLDIASGEGYGSDLLAEVAAEVTGVDVSERAVAFAAAKYERDNLRFVVGSCAAVPLATASVDLVVSFETIEHHDQQQAMLAEIRRVLAPDGMMILSSPDKYEYADVPGYANAFHVRELYLDELRRLLAREFRFVRLFGQRVCFGSLVAPLGGEPGAFETYMRATEGVRRSPGLSRPVYFIAVASNASPRELPVSFYDGAVRRQAEVAKLARVAERARALEVALAEAQKERAAVEALFVQRDALASQLNDRLVVELTRRRRLDETRAALEEQVARLSEHVEHWERRARECEQDRQVASTLASELDAIRSSTSWRLTAPLRRMGTTLRNAGAVRARPDAEREGPALTSPASPAAADAGTRLLHPLQPCGAWSPPPPLAARAVVIASTRRYWTDSAVADADSGAVVRTLMRIARAYGVRALCLDLAPTASAAQALRRLLAAIDNGAFCVRVSSPASPAGDSESVDALAIALSEALRHPGYLRIEGEPLVLVRDAGSTSSAGPTTLELRRRCAAAGLGAVRFAHVGEGAGLARAALAPFDLSVPYVPSPAAELGDPETQALVVEESLFARLTEGAARSTGGPAIALIEAPLLRDLARVRADTLQPRDLAPLLAVHGAIAAAEAAHDLSVVAIVHAFYPDVFAEILADLEHFALPSLQLIVTTPEERHAEIASLLAGWRRPYRLIATENRGRDVLPFLTALAHLATDALDTTIVLKLHTKRSRHRSDGDSWRRDMVNRLVEGRNFRRILARFANDPSVGLVGPAGHFLSMSAYWGANEARVQALARRMGVATVRQEHEGFFAGSMFFARLAALRPVIALALAPDDFEEESAQVDGTLAHAVERLFSIACTHAGMRQLDTDEVLHPERPTLPIEDYRHAPPPPPPDLRKQAGPPALAPTVGIG